MALMSKLMSLLCFYAYLVLKYYFFVWCPGQNKRLAPPSFFYGCRKGRLKEKKHSHLKWTAIRRRYHLSQKYQSNNMSAVFFKAKPFCVSEEYLICLWYHIWDNAWLVCLCMNLQLNLNYLNNLYEYIILQWKMHGKRNW
jgi:hypothetical protein